MRLQVFGCSARDLDMHQVYDVSHNIAKVRCFAAADASPAPASAGPVRAARRDAMLCNAMQQA